SFPKLIAPNQPFRDVRAISYEALPSVCARVRMTGDVFETEDHRNWTDDSFKTYSRPLSLPYPYRVRMGERINQSVSLTFEGALPRAVSEDGAVSVSVCHDARSPFPQVNFQRLEIDLTSSTWRDELSRAGTYGPWECAVFTREPDAELAPFLAELERIHPRIRR